MKAKNFKIEQSIYIVTQGHEFDLHNNYDFCGYAFDVAQRSLDLCWRKTDGDWAPANAPSTVSLRCLGVGSIEVIPRNPKLPFTEDDCLQDICFLVEQDGPKEPFASAKMPENSWRWVFQFMSGTAIIVAADEIEAIAEPEPLPAPDN